MKILLFGIAKDIVGKPSLTIEEKAPSSVLELKALISEMHPAFGELSSFAVAVNSAYAADSTPILSCDEIAIIPPVSGG